MKLQRRKAYDWGGKAVYKRLLNVPAEVSERLGWDGEDTELEWEIRGDSWIVRKAKR